MVFETDASNLVAGDGDDDTDIVVRDRLRGATRLVSVDLPAAPLVDPGDFDAVRPTVSGNGRVVGFGVAGRDPVGGGFLVVGPFLRDLAARTTTTLPVALADGTLLGRVTLADSGRQAAYVQVVPVGPGDHDYAAVVVNTASNAPLRVLSAGTLSGRSGDNVEVALAGNGNAGALALR